MRPTLLDHPGTALEAIPEQVSLPTEHVVQSTQPSAVTTPSATTAIVTEKNVQVVNAEKSLQPSSVASLKPTSRTSSTTRVS